MAISTQLTPALYRPRVEILEPRAPHHVLPPDAGSDGDTSYYGCCT